MPCSSQHSQARSFNFRIDPALNGASAALISVTGLCLRLTMPKSASRYKAIGYDVPDPQGIHGPLISRHLVRRGS